jgi:methylaspartate ammonia-lyase
LFVTDLICVPARSGFFTDDQAAIRAGAGHDGFTYAGDPVTPGFRAVRQAGEALSVLLVLTDGQVAHGDCAAVQYSGVGGRDGVFAAREALPVIDRLVRPVLVGAELTSFRALADVIDALADHGRPLHTAVRYGVTQALLDAVARARRLTMAEVIRDEYRTGVAIAPVPMFVQSGDDRFGGVDKMILKEAAVLPHGLINQVGGKLGQRGEILADYVAWVRDRIAAIRPRPDYVPTLHFDVYGTVGAAFGGDVERVAGYLASLEEAARPFGLQVEHAIDAGSRDAQVAVSAKLRAALRGLGSGVRIVVDEWCNTLADIEAFTAAGAADVIHVKTPDLGGLNNTAAALLHVRRSGLAAYCGGTCNETDRSAQICAHVAMACGAAQVLAKPGMGVDEGMMIVGNEMARAAALAAARERAAAGHAAGDAAGDAVGQGAGDAVGQGAGDAA